uniref:ANK_REP_REGION domain-containing protein n=1 Tax=Macrostomum lignano TaxID=282301 RepID=A0A1I8JB15_9PLAT
PDTAMPRLRIITPQRLATGTAEDTILREVIQRVTTGNWSSAKDTKLQPYVKVREHLRIWQDGPCLAFQDRAIIPQDLRGELLEFAYAGHPGVVRTKQQLREFAWWPRMEADVETFVRDCETAEKLSSCDRLCCSPCHGQTRRGQRSPSTSWVNCRQRQHRYNSYWSSRICTNALLQFLESYRSTLHALTGKSPDELMLGRHWCTSMLLLAPVKNGTAAKSNIAKRIQQRQQETAEYTNQRRGAQKPTRPGKLGSWHSAVLQIPYTVPQQAAAAASHPEQDRVKQSYHDLHESDTIETLDDAINSAETCPPAPFNSRENFDDFLSRMSAFMSRFPGLGEHGKIATLIAYLGPAFATYAAWFDQQCVLHGLPVGSNLEHLPGARYDSLLQFLRARHGGAKSTALLRLELRSRCRGKDETFEQFLTALQRLAVKAFPDAGAHEFLQQAVLDQFIQGLNNSYVTERLLNMPMPVTTTEQALRWAQQIRETQQFLEGQGQNQQHQRGTATSAPVVGSAALPMHGQRPGELPKRQGGWSTGPVPALSALSKSAPPSRPSCQPGQARFVTARICRRRRPCLIDTGAEVSCISLNIARSIRRQFKPSKTTIYGVSGNPASVLGEIHLYFSLGSVQFQHTFLVVTDLNVPIILGCDFLDKQDCSIHLGSGCLVFNGLGATVPLRKSKQAAQSSKLVAAAAVQLQPGEGWTVPVRPLHVTAWTSSEAPGIVNGSRSSKVLIARCVAKISNNGMGVAIINASDAPVAVREGDTIGWFTPLSSQGGTQLQSTSMATATTSIDGNAPWLREVHIADEISASEQQQIRDLLLEFNDTARPAANVACQAEKFAETPVQTASTPCQVEAGGTKLALVNVATTDPAPSAADPQNDPRTAGRAPSRRKQQLQPRPSESEEFSDSDDQDDDGDDETGQARAMQSNESLTLRERQLKDADIGPVFRLLAKGKTRLSDQQRARLPPGSLILAQKIKELCFVDGALHRLVESKQQLIDEIHEVGHLGEAKTLAGLKSRCYWPKMSESIRVAVRACQVCQRAKTSGHQRAPLRSIVSSFPMQRIGIDVVKIGVSRHGNDRLLTIMDYFTKWVELVPMPDEKAATIARALFDNWVSRSVNATSGFTPHFLMTGREVTLPLDIVYRLPEPPRTTGQFAADNRDRLLSAFESVRLATAAAQRRQRRYYDQKAARRRFRAGDLVWLFVPPSALSRTSGLPPKHQAPWTGPFRVLRRTSPVNYLVRPVEYKDGDAGRVVHVNKLKRAHQPRPPDQPRSGAASDDSSEVLDADWVLRRRLASPQSSTARSLVECTTECQTAASCEIPPKSEALPSTEVNGDLGNSVAKWSLSAAKWIATIANIENLTHAATSLSWLECTRDEQAKAFGETGRANPLLLGNRSSATAAIGKASGQVGHEKRSQTSHCTMGQLSLIKYSLGWPLQPQPLRCHAGCTEAKAADSALMHGYLPDAASHGHLELVKFLVPTVADQKQRDYCCIKAAESAAVKGHIEIVKFLVPTVADQTKRDDCCIKAAEYAAVKGHIEIVKFLVPTVAAQTIRDDCCIKAAGSAGRYGHIEIVKFLVPTVADQTKRDDCCIKAAGSAGRYGHIEIVKFLVPTVADQTKRDDCCIKAAEYAAVKGHIEIVKFLVPTVADQTIRDDCCIKAAGSAGRYGHIEIVKFLVPTVADQTKRDDCCIKAAEYAAIKGHIEIVKFLVPTVADQTKRDDCCIKAAGSAGRYGHIEIVKFLVPTVADQTKRDDCCIKAAESAGRDGHIEIVKFLVPTVADQTIRDDCCIKAAGSAGRYGHIEIVKFLVPTVADQTKRDDCCIKAAGSAGRYGHIEIVKFLVPTVADQTKRDDCCIKAAESAGRDGHIEIVKFLVPTVADQTKRDDCCIKAAESAGRNGHIEIVKFLVPTVADQTKRDDCCIKAAKSAADEGHIEIVKFLVPTVADQTKRDDCCIKAAKSAADEGHIEIVKFLVPTVADQTKRDDCCIKAAKSAADEGHIEIVKFLVPTVADQTKRDDCRIKAAEYAAVKGHIEIVKFLVPTVADQTKRDDCCIKAAASAAFNGHIEIVKFLVPTVADQTKRDDCRIKAAESAGRNGHFEIVKFLVPTVADQTKRDDCCIKAAKSAADEGHIEIVKFLVPTVADQTKRDDCRIKAAESAGRNGHFEIVKFLVLTVADQTKRDDCCIKAAASAAFNGHIEIVKFLVPTVADQTKRDDCCIKAAEYAAVKGHMKSSIADQTKRDDCCIKAAKSAADEGHIEIVKFLVPTVADQTKRDDCCIKAAEYAAIKGHIEIVKFLVPTVADQTKRDDCCIKAAESAAVKGHIEIVKFLVPTVADQTKRDDCCIKAAEYAAVKGHIEIVKFLVPTVADQTIRDDCCIKAAGSAGRYGHIEIVKFLVPTVADQTKRDDCCIKAAKSAADEGHIEIVKFLVPTVADQTKRDDCCIKAAKSAADEGHIEIVKFLVPTVADQTKRDDCRIKAAEYAAVKGHIEIVKFLVPTVADQTKRDDCCIKAAASAAFNGHIEIVKFLVPTVADQTKRDDCRIKAAESAGRNGHFEIVKFLVPTVADQTKRDDCCIKAAKSAADEGHIEIVKFLVPTVADQTKRDDCRIKAAESAGRNGHFEIVKFLVLTVADQTKRDDCCIKAAASAAFNGHIEIVKFLVPTVADQTKRDDCCIKAAEYAAVKGHMEIVKFLVPTVADQTKRDDCCIKAAKSAADEGHIEIVKFLVPTVADQTKRDDCRIKAAEYAGRYGHIEIVKFLVPTVADQTKRDDCCIKAAASAAFNGHIEIVKFLVPTVADQTKRDDCRIKAAESAGRNGHFEIVKFLVPTVADQTKRDDCCIKAAGSAGRYGHIEIVKFLVPTVADQTKRDDCRIKAAESAGRNGHFEIVKFLVLTVADQTKRDDCCIKAAESAYSNGHFEIVKFLVPTVADQTKRDDCCIKAAESAAVKGHMEIVKFLVPTVADQTKRDDCCIKAAASAGRYGHMEIVKFLVPTVADQTKRDDWCIKAAESAASNGLQDVVEFLISFLSSPDQRANLRFQCAVATCSRLHEDVAAFLGLEPDWLFQSSTILSFTAAMAIEGRNSVLTDTLSRMQPPHITQLLRLSISQRHVALAVTIAVTLINDERVSTQHVDLPEDSTGATALMLAADAGHHELIEKLIDLGASVRAEDSQGRTALSRACEAGHVRAAKALMDRGADASHRDGRGQTCAQVAQRFEQQQVLRLLHPSEAGSPEARQAAAHRLESGRHRLSDDSQQDRRLSEELHRLLSEAGFTEERAKCQQRLADWLEEVAQVLTQDDRQMTGSYAEGWANSLVQVNGRTAADSDIDWTVLVAGQEFHLEGGCDREGYRSCRDATRLQVMEGHAQVAVGAGSQPAVTATACGVRPAQDTCHAIECCSSFCEDRSRKPVLFNNRVHLVRATRPSSTNELRVSFSFQEKYIMGRLSTVQGQLFTLIKFIFKRHLPLTLDTPGLKTYHAKTLLFTMLEKHGTDTETDAWKLHNLIALLKESLDLMLSFIDSSSSPDECMPHFFMPDAPLYFKNAGIGGDFDNTKARVRDGLFELRSDIGGVVEQLRRLVRPLQSEKFYFHPFTLLPLTAPPAVTEIREGSGYTEMYYNFADVYSVVHQCTLFTARLSQPLSSHLYVNFRCLSWSLQAELLCNRAPAIKLDDWKRELEEDPDLEELLTLAHYSDCREHVELSLQQMEMIEKERRVVMETQDEEKIGWVRQKRWRVSNRSGSDSGAHRSREDEERRLWARARLRRDGVDLGRFVAMETAAEQRDSWTHVKLIRMRLQVAHELPCEFICTDGRIVAPEIEGSGGGTGGVGVDGSGGFHSFRRSDASVRIWIWEDDDEAEDLGNVGEEAEDLGSWGQVPEERCPFCRSGSENAEHFICHCPVFTRARLTHLGPNPARFSPTFAGPRASCCSPGTSGTRDELSSSPPSVRRTALQARPTGPPERHHFNGSHWSPGASGMGGLLRLLAASAGRPLQLIQSLLSPKNTNLLSI